MSATAVSTTSHVFERDFPTQGTAESVHDEQDLHRAVEAYRFFYPTISAEGIFNGARELGIADGAGIMVLAAGPRHVVFTANSDTPYASATLDLQAMGPVVIDVPAGPYIGLVDDHHQRWILDMGIPGPDAGKGGKYLVLPPGFSGDVPPRFHIGRAATYKAFVALRTMPIGGDVRGAREALRAVRIHPLKNPSGVLPYIDCTDRDLDATPLRWENNLEYWRKLQTVVDGEPVLEEYRPMYGLLAALGIRKGKPFTPDERMKRILQAASNLALEQMRVEAFASQRSDRIVWKERRWEWVGLVADDPNFEAKSFLDLVARDRWFFQAIVASPAMFRRKVGSGSVYYLAVRDEKGTYLDGSKTYKLTIPHPVPASLFWSVTAYDAKTRSQVRNAANKAVLGSLGDRLEPNGDGNIEIYIGATAPPGDEYRWIQTVPGAGFFLYFRIYGPEAGSLDGSWKPSDPALVANER